MALPVYSSKDVSVAWTGVTLDGLAPDSFVTFSRSSDLTDEEVGSDGQVGISRMADRTGTCTISLQQNSKGNLILSGIMAAQEAASSLITGSLTIVDPSGSVLALLTNAHLKTAPEVGLGSTATGKTRDWVFFCEGMTYTAAPEGIADDAGFLTEIAGGISGILGNI